MMGKVADRRHREHLARSPWLEPEGCTCREGEDGRAYYACRNLCGAEGKACGGYCRPCFDARMAEAALPRTLGDLGDQMLADSRAWFGQSDVHWQEVTHFALGLGGETGEVLDVIKKADVCGEFTDVCEMHDPGKHSIEALAAEMADVLTYLLALAASLDIDLLAAYRTKRAANIDRWGEPKPIEAPR